MADPRLEPLVLSQAERRVLENWVKRRKTAQRLALRARILLACAGGGARFLAQRLDGLGDERRPGAPRTITDAQVEEVVARTRQCARRRAVARPVSGHTSCLSHRDRYFGHELAWPSDKYRSR